jgi:hypothetical protein
VHDIDQDGTVGAADFAMFVQAYEGQNGDCNANGSPDLQDLLTGTSIDANLDGVPDECVPCRGDLNSDRIVNGADLGALLAVWGQSDVPGDLNLDGIVNGADLGALLAAWGGCP